MTASVARPKRGPECFIHKRNQTYVGVFYVNRRRVQRTLAPIEQVARTPAGRLRTKDAQNWMLGRLWDEKAEELREEASRATGPARPIGELMEEWIAVSRSLGKKPGTLDYATRTRKSYLKAVGDHPIGEIGVKQIERFTVALNGLGLSGESVNIRLRQLKTFLRWAYDRGELDRVARVQMVRVDRKLPRVHTDDQLAALFARLRRLQKENPNPAQQHAYHLHERFLMVAMGTAARRAEVFWLRWDQIDLQGRKITIRTQARYTVKERRDKVLAMEPGLLSYLKRERAGHPAEVFLLEARTPGKDGQPRMAYTSPDALTLAFRRHLGAVGVKRMDGIKPTHGFRAGWITRAFAEGVDLTTIQHTAGHSSSRVTEGYLANPDAHQRAAVEIVGKTVEKLRRPKRKKREPKSDQPASASPERVYKP